jgi:integrase/recombinase XerC
MTPLADLLTDFLRYLTLERNAAPTTVKSYREDLTQAVGYLTDRAEGQLSSMDLLTAPLLRTWLAWLRQQEYAPSTIARHVASVRSWCRYLVRQGILVRNPAAGLRTKIRRKRLPRHLKPEEMEDLLAMVAKPIPPRPCYYPPCQGMTKGRQRVRDRAIIEVLYSSGVRVAELVALDLADVDLEAGQAKVPGKGRRERLIVLGPPAMAALRAWLQVLQGLAAASPALFLNHFGNRLAARTVDRVLKKYATLAGLDPRTSPHAIRHSCASAMLNAGCDVRIVQEMLGHRDLSSTQIYTHVSTTFRRRCSMTSSAMARSGMFRPCWRALASGSRRPWSKH